MGVVCSDRLERGNRHSALGEERKTGAIVYQIKVFTASNPGEVEGQVNRWLTEHRERAGIRLVDVTSTDVIQVSSKSGIQRFTLVMVYEVI